MKLSVLVMFTDRFCANNLDPQTGIVNGKIIIPSLKKFIPTTTLTRK